MEPVKDINIENCENVRDIIEQFEDSGGFSSKILSEGFKITEQMINDGDCKVFFSFPACIVATGTRGVIKELVKRKMVDVIVTTCGTLDHDLARLWEDYYKGKFGANDEELHEEGINRLGNVFVPNESYGMVLEEKMQPILEGLYEEKKEWNTRDLIWKFGEAIRNEENAEESIIYWAWKNEIPIFVPGITDGAFGSQLWLFWQDHENFKLNLLEDEQELSNIVHESNETGALMLGGGISKHHTIWWNQFIGGLNYAVQITTAVEWDGSLSGARVKEGVSWGKIKEDAKKVTIPGDATIFLPILLSYLLED